MSSSTSTSANASNATAKPAATTAVNHAHVQSELTRGDLEVSRLHCHGIARTRAKNFYYGMKLTPEPKRSAMYAVYAWMREADDLADAAGEEAGKRQRIELFRQRTHAMLGSDLSAAECRRAGPMWPAVRDAFIRYEIRGEDLDDMIAGQLLDQHKAVYETFDELYDYCYKVASVVGLVCINVWGYSGSEETRKMAEHRGIALQLTNILRDVAEDAQRGRYYLPREDFERFDYNCSDIQNGVANEAFDRFMAYQIERARSYYEKSAALEQNIDKSCRATSWAMMRIYRGLLNEIARNPRQVLTRRVSLSKMKKLFIGLRATMKSG